MASAFDLPPGTERFSRTCDRLAFEIGPEGTRRLVRIARVAHVEQHLTVGADTTAGEIVLRQRYGGEAQRMRDDDVSIGMAPEEARAVAAALVAAADRVEAEARPLAGTGAP